MLMTVLKGELAVEQSKALIRTFKGMKDFIVENRYLIGNKVTTITEVADRQVYHQIVDTLLNNPVLLF